MHILVRPLQEPDLPDGPRIFRLAFGTFNGLANPLEFGGDLDKIRTRWLADPAAAFGAEVDGTLVGSNFVTHWGSVGYFGPLTVDPDYWDQGIGQKLLEPTLALFPTWGCRHTGLYTYFVQPQAPGAVSEIWFLAPMAHGRHVLCRSPPAGPPPRGSQLLLPGVELHERPGLVKACASPFDLCHLSRAGCGPGRFWPSRAPGLGRHPAALG